MIAKSLFAGASLLALGLVSTNAYADPLTISTATTAPVKTSTASASTPGDITITSAGSVKPTTAGPAVTIDSNNKVDNQGTIQITGVNDARGIQAANGVTSTITHSGSVILDEDYTRTDSNSDGVLDGPFAQGTNRVAIETLGSFTGTITTTSTSVTTVEGNNSAGIKLGGTLTGSLTAAGTVTVIGNDGVGIRTGAVTGDVTIGGTIVVAGQNSSAVVIGGDIGGAFKFNAAAQATGYSTLTLPTDTSKLLPENKLLAGPAVSITGNVAGGVQFLNPVSTTASDGTITTVAGASIAAYSNSPAVLIGSSTNAITLGSIASDANGFGLELGGTLAANGLFSGVNATAVKVGGLGNAVNVTNGIRVTGTIATLSNGGSSTGLDIATGANAPTLVVSGSISTATAGTIATGTTPTATALLIENGASVGSLTNTGSIAAAGVAGTTTRAIYDQSGTLKSITNTGQLGASGTGTNIAIDLTSVTSGASITQSAPATGTVAPVLAGAILFGGGSNSLTVNAGTVNGDVTFAGSGNSLTLANAATYTGTANFAGAAGTLTLGGTSKFTGIIKNGANTAVTVNGGTLAPSIGTSTAGSLAMTGGTLQVTIDGSTASTSLLQVAGNASFTGAVNVAVDFTKLGNLAGNFTFLQAGSLTGANNLTLSTNLPFLFTGSLSTNTANNSVGISIARKSATQLGLSGNYAAIYDPAVIAATTDDPIGQVFLDINSTSQLTTTLGQMMPVYETGALDAASLATRAINSLYAEQALPALQGGSLGGWIQMIGWTDEKSAGATQAYSTFGAGFVLGVEHSLGNAGRVGISGTYAWGVNKEELDQDAANTSHAQIGLYWRATWGGFHAYATGAYGRLSYDNTRTFISPAREASANWNATLYSGGAGLSYQFESKSFYARPSVSVDYVNLKEDGYTETGGGTGFNLIVDPRSSSETGIGGAVAVGKFLRRPVGRDADFLKVEIEGGYRDMLDSKVGNTTAHFAGGNSFTLVPEARATGWTARLRVIGGGDTFSLSGEVGAEKQQDHVAGIARVGIHFSF